MAERKVITPEEIVYTTEKDLLEQDYEVKEWERRFKELESEWWTWPIYLTFVVALHGPPIRLGGNFYLRPIEWKIDLTEPLNQVKLDGTGPH